MIPSWSERWSLAEFLEQLLGARFWLQMAPPRRQEISVDPAIFDGYAGRYQLAPAFILTIARHGDRLFLQASCQGTVELFAQGDKDYFSKDMDAQLTFVTGPTGSASAVILRLHQTAASVHAKRIE